MLYGTSWGFKEWEKKVSLSLGWVISETGCLAMTACKSCLWGTEIWLAHVISTINIL